MAPARAGANKAAVAGGEARPASVRQVEAESVEAGRSGHAHFSLTVTRFSWLSSAVILELLLFAETSTKDLRLEHNFFLKQERC